jgi:branched-chain amino acid transport system permease protein
MSYALHLLIFFFIYATVGLGLNIVVGYCGFLTLAQAGFFAIGCYSYGLGALVFHWGFLEGLLCAVILAGVLSLLPSLASWRLRGDFFVMASLAVQAFVFSALNNWSEPGAALGSLSNLTNGPLGLPGIPGIAIFSIRLDTRGSIAALAAAIFAVAWWLTSVLGKSPWGRTLQAMRDDELAARTLGKNVRRLKVQAFALSSVLAASAGALYAAYVRYVDPTIASLDHSILMLSMLIVGGIGTRSGPVLGAAVLIAIPEILRFVSISDANVGSMRLLVFGLLLLIAMHVRPQGLLGRVRLN